MLAIAIALLSATGPKGFFQNPAYLIGLPLVILGLLGILLALAPIELRWPQPRPAAAEGEAQIVAAGHPTAEVYVTVGLVLAVVTMLEVMVYYMGALKGALIGILLTLSALKFALVALWFMHLRFDNRVFSVLFVGGLMLVVALFFVVLASLGASLA